MRVKSFIVLLVVALSSSGCACWQPTSPKFTSAACELARQEVACVPGLVADAGKALVTAEVDSGTVSPSTLEAALVKGGYGSPACILDAVAAAFGAPRLASYPSEVDRNRAAFVAAWRAQRRIGGGGPMLTKG